MAQMTQFLSRNRPPGGFAGGASTVSRPPGLGLGGQTTAGPATASGPITAGISTMTSLKQQADRMLEQQQSMASRADQYRNMWQTVIKEQEQTIAELTRERAAHSDLRARVKEDERHAVQLLERVTYMEDQQILLQKAVTDAKTTLDTVDECRRVLEHKLSDQAGLCAEFQDKYSTLEQALREVKLARDAALDDLGAAKAALHEMEAALHKAIDERDVALHQLAAVEQQLGDQRTATEAAEAAFRAKAGDLQAMEQAHQQATAEWQAREGLLEGGLAAVNDKHAQALQELEDARAAHSADKERIQELNKRLDGLTKDMQMQQSALHAAQGQVKQYTEDLAAAGEAQEKLENQLKEAQGRMAELQGQLDAAMQARVRAAEVERELVEAKDKLTAAMAEKEAQLAMLVADNEQLQLQLDQLKGEDFPGKLAMAQQELAEFQAAAAEQQAQLEIKLKAAKDATAAAEKDNRLFVARTQKECDELRVKLSAAAEQKAAELTTQLAKLQDEQASLSKRLASELAGREALQQELQAAKETHQTALASMWKEAEAQIEQERQKLAEQTHAAAEALSAAHAESARQLEAVQQQLQEQLATAQTEAAAAHKAGEEALARQQEGHEAACKTLMEQLDALNKEAEENSKEAEESQVAWADKVERLEGSMEQLRKELATALNQIAVLGKRETELESLLKYEQSKNERVMTEMRQRLEEAPTQPQADAAQRPSAINMTASQRGAASDRAASDQGRAGSQQPSAGGPAKPSQAAASSMPQQHKTSELGGSIPMESAAAGEGVTALQPSVTVAAGDQGAVVQVTVDGAVVVAKAAEAAGKENEPLAAAAAAAPVKANGQAPKANARRANKRAAPAPEPEAAPVLWADMADTDEDGSSPEATNHAKMLAQQRTIRDAAARKKQKRSGGQEVSVDAAGAGGVSGAQGGMPPPAPVVGVQQRGRGAAAVSQGGHKGGRLGAMSVQSAGVSEHGPEASSKHQARKPAAGRTSRFKQQQEQAGGVDKQAHKQPRNKSNGTGNGGGSGVKHGNAATSLFGTLSSNPYTFN